MDHRGPDAFGHYENDYCVLAHNRLSIIDHSTEANQPMVSDCGRYVIVFNGEIFNFLELREQLSSAGVSFKTNSDTEVLLRLLIQKGDKALDEIDGMFAFVFWDATEQTLFGARDHAGIKPLFYQHTASNFSFASELKSLRNLNQAKPEIDHVRVFEYLMFGYVPSPYSIYQGIKSLPPGYAFRYVVGTNKLKSWRWATSTKTSTAVSSFDEAVDGFCEIFHRSVRRRCIADVPLGAFLSGGLDSSAIVAEMTNISNSVSTFSIGYLENKDYDESRCAIEVANHLGTSHSVLYPEISPEHINEYLDRIIAQFDQPFANPTVIMTYLLTASVQSEVKVALIGDGGDEICAGYPRHRAIQLINRHRSWWRAIKSPTLGVLGLLPETPGANHLGRRLRQFLAASDQTNAGAYAEWMSVFRRTDLEVGMTALGDQALSESRLDFFQSLFEEAHGDVVTKALHVDRNSFLPYNLMDGSDRMSMANSFELRLPFLSRELMDFVNGLPTNYKIQGKVQKRLLRAAYQDRLPPQVFNRPKRGFNPPVWDWLMANKEFVSDHLAPGCRTETYVSPAFIQKTVAALLSQKQDTSLQVWSLLVLERWLAINL